MFGTKTIRNYEERRAALKKRKAEITEAAASKSRELEKQIGKTNKQAEADIEAADAGERATMRQLQRELVRDAYAALEPLVASWREEPSRVLTLKIGEVLEQLLERERTELGDMHQAPRVMRVLAFVYTDGEVKARPDAVKQFAHVDQHPGRAVERVGAVRRALGSANELDLALRALESDVETVARQPVAGDVEPALERYKLVRTLDAEDVAELDAKRAAADREDLARHIATIPTREEAVRRHLMHRARGLDA